MGNSLIERRACDGKEEIVKVGILLKMGWGLQRHRKRNFLLFNVFMYRDMKDVLLIVFPLIVAQRRRKTVMLRSYDCNHSQYQELQKSFRLNS